MVGVAAAALALLAYATHVTRRPELSTVDARFSVRGTQKPPRDVVLVGIDAQTLGDLNVRPPLPRRLDARVIDRLRRAGARVIAVDLAFDGPTEDADDRALFNAVRRAGNVVLATTIIDNGQSNLDVGSLRAVAGSGNFRARGGVFRQLEYDDQGLPTFAVAAARRAGRTIDRGAFSGDGAWIDFAGPAGTIPTIHFSDVVAGKAPASAFRGKVVVVGGTDPSLHDIHQAASGDNMPGPEIQANAIATILRGFPLRAAAGWLSVLLIVLAGLVVPLSALRLTGLRWLPVPVVFALVYAVVAQLAFDGGTILPVVAPALALLLAFFGTLAVAYATDVRDRQRLRVAFSRFVPPEVVDEVVAQADDELRLGGTRLQSTVLFCDLRSFTTIAEQMEAEQVIEMLNRYLAEMSDAILDHGGTVVAYMGDGIMAVFGAPLPSDDHADRAVAAAREMVGARLARFNEWALGAGIAEPFSVGVGVCSGPVMSGNVGSARRLEYAAVGDTTNTAARLQGMTKELGCPVVIAASTVALLSDGAGLVSVGEVEVRGRAASVEVWTFSEGANSAAREE